MLAALPQITYIEKPKRLFYEDYLGKQTSCITPDSNPYTVPFEIYQRDGLNYVYVHVAGSDKPTLTVTGLKESITLEKIWNKLLELETAIIVSNGEI